MGDISHPMTGLAGGDGSDSGCEECCDECLELTRVGVMLLKGFRSLPSAPFSAPGAALTLLGVFFTSFTSSSNATAFNPPTTPPPPWPFCAPGRHDLERAEGPTCCGASAGEAFERSRLPWALPVCSDKLGGVRPAIAALRFLGLTQAFFLGGTAAAAVEGFFSGCSPTPAGRERFRSPPADLGMDCGEAVLDIFKLEVAAFTCRFIQSSTVPQLTLNLNIQQIITFSAYICVS